MASPEDTGKPEAGVHAPAWKSAGRL